MICFWGVHDRMACAHLVGSVENVDMVSNGLFTTKDSNDRQYFKPINEPIVFQSSDIVVRGIKTYNHPYA